MEDLFCEDEFWNWNLTWYAPTPDLPRCFHDTGLLWMSCAPIFVFAILEATMERRGRHLPLPWTPTNITKIVLCCIICAVHGVGFIRAATSDRHERTRIGFLSSSIQFGAVMVAQLLLFLHRNSGKVTSASLFVFWMIYSVACGLRFRTAFLDELHPDNERTPTAEFVMRATLFPLAVAQFILSCFADRTAASLLALKGATKRNPLKEASILSAITFWWFNSVVRLGFKRSLRLEDLWHLDEENTSDEILRNFQPHYDSERARATKDQNSNRFNVLYPVVKTIRGEILPVTIYRLIEIACTFTFPLILDKLITFIKSDEPIWKGVFLVSLGLISSLVGSVFASQYEFRVKVVEMRIRSALSNAIYQKALHLSGQARAKYTTGEIVNMMSVDTTRFVNQLNFSTQLWSVPLQIAISIFMLWQHLGIACLAALTVLISFIPLNASLSAVLRKSQASLMKEKDSRAKLMSEILNGIKILKLYAWEPAFFDRVTALRSIELAVLKKEAYVLAVMVLSFTIAPFLVALSAFTVYVLTGNTLDSNTAFVSLSIFNILRLPMAWLPLLISYTTMFIVSLKRLNKFFRCDELDPNAVTNLDVGSELAVKVENATFKFSQDAEKAALRNIDIEIQRGSLVAVVGTVGSGKSTLLEALMGSLYKTSGGVSVSGSVAYVPQQAWIQGATIEENITFGRELEKAKFEEVLATCALHADLETLPGGVQTEVGENGINLSGGQKQRISLARAIYSGADVFYLDDPFSAIDPQVCHHIFEKVLSHKGLLAGKTRILVTHRLSLLAECDFIYVIKEGTISEKGTYKQLMECRGAFAEFLVEHLQEKEEQCEIPADDFRLMEEIVKQGSAPPQLATQISRVSSQGADSDSGFPQRRSSKARSMSTVSAQSNAALEKRVINQKAMLVEEEREAQGSVSWKVYLDYARAMGLGGVSIAVMACVIISVFNVISTFWLSAWSEDSLDSALANSTEQRNYRLTGYALLGTGEAVFGFTTALALHLTCVRGAQILHNNMLTKLLKAPMSFFDTTPTGRILNRFTKDLDVADTELRLQLRYVSLLALRATVPILVISFETPLFIAFIVPLMIIYFFIQRFYIATQRQLKRILSTTRSPVFVHFSESLTGSTSIRCYGHEKRFIRMANHKVDINNRSQYCSLAATRWISFRLEVFGILVVFMASILAIYGKTSLSPGIAALCITYAMTLTHNLNAVVQIASSVEANFVAVERCLEYTNLESEDEWVKKDSRPPGEWPSEGRIEFKNYSTRYREGLPLVVKGISITLKAGEKIGVVGRTGAGKSSLSLALFRLIEPAGGSIEIDSVDISNIGLHDLRSTLTIIPQDPVLFTGTIRDNLSPYADKKTDGKDNDDDLWRALELSHLKNFIVQQDKGLALEVNEGGANFSVGQRQLVCLARALLRKTKILVLDEATAAVDMETDKLIQETLRREFKDSTTFTIAHRINTIIDYDRILVLADGRVAEFDTPGHLLENTKSIFYSMAQDAGILKDS